MEACCLTVRCSCGRRFTDLAVHAFLSGMSIGRPVKLMCSKCGITTETKDVTIQIIEQLIEATVVVDVEYLRAHSEDPPLPCPRPEAPGRDPQDAWCERVERHDPDEFWEVARILEGSQACPEDLVAWRCAELRASGFEADPVLRIDGRHYEIGVRFVAGGDFTEEWYHRT